MTITDVQRTPPWLIEPDHAEFVASGLDCILHRNSFDCWCGYVRVDEAHPLFRVECGDSCGALADALERRKAQPLGENPGISLMIDCICGQDFKPTPDTVFQVHGGLTWSKTKAADGTGRDGWWFGFDCSHGGDFHPNYPASLRQGTYRTIDYARMEVERLAAQLKEIGGSAPCQ